MRYLYWHAMNDLITCYFENRIIEWSMVTREHTNILILAQGSVIPCSSSISTLSHPLLDQPSTWSTNHCTQSHLCWLHQHIWHINDMHQPFYLFIVSYTFDRSTTCSLRSIHLMWSNLKHVQHLLYYMHLQQVTPRLQPML